MASRMDWPQWGQGPEHQGMVSVDGQRIDRQLADVTYDPFVPQEVADGLAVQQHAGRAGGVVELDAAMLGDEGELARVVHLRLAAQGLCQRGDLVKHVIQAGVQAGHNADLASWTGAAIVLAVDETKAFETRVRQQAAGRNKVA